MRRVSSCGDIDVELGWQDSITTEACDQCWALGGPYTETAKKYREKHVTLVVSAVKRAGIETFRQDVRHAMLDKWVHSSDKEDIIARIKLHGDKKPTIKWLGMAWEGVPFPKWPFICTKHAAIMFYKTWSALRTGGCGCNIKAKRAARGLVSWLKGS